LSVETKGVGTLRLRCDVSDCPRLFIPRRPYNAGAARALRKHAEMYGWLSASGLDLCPEHRGTQQKLPGVG
jgi:hypothetical protein